MDLYKMSVYPAGPNESIREMLCHGVKIHPIHKPLAGRADKIHGSALQSVDPKGREPKKKLALPKVTNRGFTVPKSQPEALHTHAPRTGPSFITLDSSTVSLPLLCKIQPSRPVQPTPRSLNVLLNVTFRGRICQRVSLLKRPTERDDRLQGSTSLESVHHSKRRQPEQKLTRVMLVDRGHPMKITQFKPLLPHAPPSRPSIIGLNDSKVSLPLLGHLPPCRPVERRLHISSVRRTQQ